MATLRTINSQDSAGIGDDSARNVSSPQRFRMQENVLANKPEDSQGERRLESFLDINQDNRLDPGPSGIKQVSDHEVSRHEVKDKLTSADYIKGKLPGLVELTLPSTPELPSNSLNESWMGTGDPSHDSDDSTGADSPITDPFLESIPIPTFVRLKTRLQDPPPLTPAVKSQLTYCRSSLTRQRTFLASNAEEHTSKVECGSVGVMPSQEMDQSASTQTNASLGHISSSSKMNKEDEKDALDEDYIANKKFEDNKWLIVTQWCSLLTLVALLVCTNKIRRLEKVTFLGLNLWRWQALTLVIFCGHLISGWIMKLFVSLIEKHYLLKKKVLYFVYGLRHSVKSCIWLALVLGVWEVIFQGHEDTLAVNILTRILWCLFTASISWMVKVLAVKVAANSFHRKAYFDRIQECVFNQYLLERLSGPPITPHGDCTDGSNTKQTVTHLRKHKGAAHSLKVPKVTFPKALLKVQSENLQSEIQIVGQTFNSNLPGRRTVHSKLTAIWHKGCRKLSNVQTPHLYGIHMQQDKSSLHTQDDGSIKEEIIGEKEAPHHNVIDVGCMTPVASTSMQSPGQKMSAPQLPTSARSPDTIQQEKLQGLTSDTVSVWTLKRLMKTIRNTNLKTYSSMLSHEKGDATINSEVQAKIVAKQVFYNMAKHGKKSITLRNFIYFLPQEQVGRAFALFETNENGEITKESVMKWVVNVYKERRALCLTLNDNKTVVEKLHRVLNAVLVLILVPVFVLIFGVETPKILVFFTSVFLPSVFIFGNSAKNAFESLIFLFVTHPFDVGDRIVVDGQTMLVEEMNILNTILLSSSNEKVYYPNSLLSIKPISNYYRSPDQWDSIEFQIHMRTPVEKVAVLKERIQKYIEGLPQFWYPDIRVACKDIEDSTKMKMVMWMRHHLNFQEGAERFQRRSNLLLYLKQQLEDLDIGYKLPQQEIIVTGIPFISDPYKFTVET